MNSYNENLQASITSSLLSQELEQKRTKAQLDAAMLTLYYAEGARITAGEKLESALDDLQSQQAIKSQAVSNSNISINLLAAAQQQKKYVAQAVTNTAVCAANLQALSNAVLRLSGDMGNILSIVNAADYRAQIYDQAEEASKCMSDTAYLAERASLSAMDASMIVAEVSSSTVADQAKRTNDSVSGMLKALSTQFDNSVALVSSDSAAFASASAEEKEAEGSLEDANVENVSTQKAYDLNVRELNMNIRTTPMKDQGDMGYNVRFAPYRSPFDTGKKHDSHYPVKDYYIILVKESQKSTFSISHAEALITNPDQAMRVDIEDQKSKKEIIQKIFISQLHDSDDELMELGKSYVVFIMATLQEDYKKTLNNFDDYLSAPSPVFSLTYTLASAEAIKFNADAQTLTFTYPDKNKDYKVDYRCMFLPVSEDLVQGLLTEKGLNTIEHEVEKLAEIAEKYDPKITELEGEITSLQFIVNDLVKQRKINEEEYKAAKAKAEKEKLAEAGTKIKEALKSGKEKLKEDIKSLATYKKERDAKLRRIYPTKPMKPGFFFNRMLAEQVLAGNYVQIEQKGTQAELKIDASITDNFGNPLQNKKKYVPAILSVLRETEENSDQFVTALSDYANAAAFVYKEDQQEQVKNKKK